MHLAEVLARGSGLFSPAAETADVKKNACSVCSETQLRWRQCHSCQGLEAVAICTPSLGPQFWLTGRGPHSQIFILLAAVMWDNVSGDGQRKGDLTRTLFFFCFFFEGKKSLPNERAQRAVLLPTQDNEMCESAGPFCIFFMFPTRVALMRSTPAQTVHRELLRKYYPSQMTRQMLRSFWCGLTENSLGPFTVHLSLLNGRLVLWVTDLSASAIT